MKFSFKRITSSGGYIPEIDGLRFIAIASVLLYHLDIFLSAKYSSPSINSPSLSFMKHLISHGNLGVPLFFCISSFILGLPFAKWHLAKGNPVTLKKYFLRRLSRMEPPYIISLSILLVGAIYVAQIIPIKDGIESYLASIIYSHSIIFPDAVSKLSVVSWSLEIEMQFYILAPLMTLIFTVNNAALRRVSMVIVAALFIVIRQTNSGPFEFVSLLDFVQYFLVGLLLADLYVNQTSILPKTKFDFLIGLVLIAYIWMFNAKDFSSHTQMVLWEITHVVSIFILYYYVLIHKIFRILTWKVITNIGGMCYSIYLLHFPIFSMFGNPLLKHSFSQNAYVNITIYSVVLVFLVLAISSVFYLLIERPCMEKEWYKKIFSRRLAVVN